MFLGAPLSRGLLNKMAYGRYNLIRQRWPGAGPISFKIELLKTGSVAENWQFIRHGKQLFQD